MHHRSWLKWSLLLVSLALLIVSGTMVVRLLRQGEQEQQAFDDLAALVTPQPEAAEEPLELPTDLETLPEETPSPYAALKEQNEDFYGWLSIEGTEIDYPVMYTPDDPEYYLRRGFDGSYAHGGVPFLDGACFPACGHLLIYGHNLNNGTMFAPLLSYADPAFREAHPTIRFDTLEESQTYTIFAAFYYEDAAGGDFSPYHYQDLRTEAAFSAYVSGVKTAALYDTGITPSYGDELLTLSTCSYHADEGRFLVVAVSNS